jgi:chromosome segregation ATPase
LQKKRDRKNKQAKLEADKAKQKDEISLTNEKIAETQHQPEALEHQLSHKARNNEKIDTKISGVQPKHAQPTTQAEAVKRDSDSTKQVAALDNNEIETQVSGS